MASFAALRKSRSWRIPQSVANRPILTDSAPPASFDPGKRRKASNLHPRPRIRGSPAPASS